MKDLIRGGIALAACALLFVFLVWGMRAMPPYGHYAGPYGNLVNASAPRARRVPNAVSAVNFDYRGVDTLGEEFILFAAVAGIVMALRRDREQTTHEPLPRARGRRRSERSEAVRAFSVLGVGATLAFGIYLAIHPHLSPGGGFQGAAIAAGAFPLVMLGLSYDTFSRVTRHEQHEIAEAIGAGAYALIGLATLAAGGSFLANVLPLGVRGSFFSGGTITLINVFVAIEVGAGFTLMFLEFAHETRIQKPEEPAP